MKDRNGKTLKVKDIRGMAIRGGDVLLCRYPNETIFGRISVISEDPKSTCFQCPDIGKVNLQFNRYVEIIGDVR